MRKSSLRSKTPTVRPYSMCTSEFIRLVYGVNCDTELHRPTRGWYLVIRSPTNPSPKAFTSLKPSSAHSPSHLVFSLHRHLFSPAHLDTSETPQRAHFLLQPHLPANAKRASGGLGHISSLFANRKHTFSLIHSQGGSSADAELLRFEDTTGCARLVPLWSIRETESGA